MSSRLFPGGQRLLLTSRNQVEEEGRNAWHPVFKCSITIYAYTKYPGHQLCPISLIQSCCFTVLREQTSHLLLGSVAWLCRAGKGLHRPAANPSDFRYLPMPLLLQVPATPTPQTFMELECHSSGFSVFVTVYVCACVCLFLVDCLKVSFRHCKTLPIKICVHLLWTRIVSYITTVLSLRLRKLTLLSNII